MKGERDPKAAVNLVFASVICAHYVHTTEKTSWLM